MDWDEIERNWTELKGEIKHQWSKLTDEDIEFVKGKYAELLGLLQERYGHAKEQAEQEVDDWAKPLKVGIVAGQVQLLRVSDPWPSPKLLAGRGAPIRRGWPWEDGDRSCLGTYPAVSCCV
jgi:uncharacterized protein YjbJ (UPF0337 family)